MKLNRPTVLIFAIAYCVILGHPATAQRDSLMNILETELSREFQSLSKVATPAYYMHYHVDDVEYTSLTASFGSLIQSSVNRNRVLATQVRVGDYRFDNTHPISSRQSNFITANVGLGPVMLPVENNKLSIQFGLWQATQAEYKQALESYKMIKNASSLKDSIGTSVPDFSKEPAEVFYQDAPPAFSKLFDKKIWEEKVKKYSAPFLANTDVVEGDVLLRFTIEKKYFLNSEGSRILQYTTSAYINISGSVRANDGDIVPLHLSYYAPVPSGLPGDDKIISDVEKMVGLLNELKSAPLAEPYSGPAILEAQTAGVFFS